LTHVSLQQNEALRRAELKTMTRVATGLLVVALVVFLVARLLEPTYPWLGFVRATAEASLIGGLADWFAVTALFRRPLGLPIPHTAIIQTQKDRIGQVLGRFVQDYFLSREALTSKLASMRLAERGARWISDPEHSAQLTRYLVAGITQAVRTLPEDETRNLIRESVTTRLQAVQIAPVLNKVLSAVATADRHQVLLDEALRLVQNALDTNRIYLREKIKEESPWWMPGVVDDILYRRLLEAAETLLDEVAADREHPLRLQFDTVFRDFVDRFKDSPDTIARTEALKRDLLGAPLVEEIVGTVWHRVRQAAEGATTPSAVGPSVTRGISAVGDSLLKDPERLTELDAMLINVVASLIEQHRHEVQDLITQTVHRWDPELAARRIELAVGRDLQFIRLNGTLVGGLAGLVLYTLSVLLG